MLLRLSLPGEPKPEVEDVVVDLADSLDTHAPIPHRPGELTQ
ncbi:hypothetical protein [Geodermatophilus normandii]|nr:hypothetical protein [Geodermatophilus normandii]